MLKEVKFQVGFPFLGGTTDEGWVRGRDSSQFQVMVVPLRIPKPHNPMVGFHFLRFNPGVGGLLRPVCSLTKKIFGGLNLFGVMGAAAESFQQEFPLSLPC